MKSLIMICVLAFTVSACATTNPARSSCFVNGKPVCKFTPIQELWAEE
ncbi:hypothetical protein [Paracoccus beibuensis]|nr:hypothetical protein [Paracoccus beibuensis]